MGSTTTTPELILYTNHRCPWAHRAQIALHELGLPFKTEIISLDAPRTAEYLAINPRGTVPTLSYNGVIIPESGIISQFLADQFPSHLLKTSDEAGGALQRAKIAEFTDAYFSKANTYWYQIFRAEGGEKAEIASKFVSAIETWVEPLLKDAAPYFGGASKFTLAEVLTAPFVLRLLDFAGEEELVPASVVKNLEVKTPNFYKWSQEVVKQKSVTYVWDKQFNIEVMKKRIAKAKAEAK